MFEDVCMAKNVALFERLLLQLDFWDVDVINLLRYGVPLVGLQEPPTGYQKLLVPASITEDELTSTAKWRRRSLMLSARPMTSNEEKALIDSTQLEVERGFLQGPYSEEELSVLLGTEDWSLNPRFVLFQGANNKVRVIDDAKQSSVNAAYSSTVKLQLQDVDYAAAMITYAMQVGSDAGVPVLEWFGKTFDLSKAYKQLAVLPEHQHHAVVGFMADGKWRFYKSISLPFGCTGSVYGFVRVSQALWFIVSKMLKAIMSHYFDDFPTIERVEGSRVLTLAVSAIFDLLGWDHAKEGDKALNFDRTFDLLGVTFCLKEMHLGRLVIANKLSRVEKISKMLEQIESDGAVSLARASEVQGLLNFAVSFYMGKTLEHLVSAFYPFAESGKTANQDNLRQLCRYAKQMLISQQPRVYSLHTPSTPILVFTDGAWESGVATAGAVVIDGDSRIAFSITVPELLVDHWTQYVGDQIIQQVELWGLLAVRWHHRIAFCNRFIIEWIDNEAARISCIKANSPSATMRSLTRFLALMEMKWPMMTWTERVCSFSNPADLPSRDRKVEAMSRYGLLDGGNIDVPNSVVEALVHLFHFPYQQTALQELGEQTEHSV